MIYYAKSIESTIKIKLEYEKALIQVLKNWAEEGNKSWITTSQVLNSNEIETVFSECRYEAWKDNNYIYIDSFIGEKWSLADDEFPYVIAPFVEDDTMISYCGEDDAIWRYVFNQGVCIEETGSLEPAWGNEDVSSVYVLQTITIKHEPCYDTDYTCAVYTTKEKALDASRGAFLSAIDELDLTEDAKIEDYNLEGDSVVSLDEMNVIQISITKEVAL